MVVLEGDIEQFPPLHQADADGLLAIGGDYSISNLLTAYCNAIFPWELGPEPYWYCPNPRYVIQKDQFKIPKRIMKLMQKHNFEYTINQSFEQVISSCARMARKDQFGTWIYPEVKERFTELHQKGYAHSVEVWHEGILVGGLYGLGIGKVFCGESMFHTVADASKCAAAVWFYLLFSKGLIEMVDCQMESPIMKRLGGEYLDVYDVVSCLPKRQELTPWPDIAGKIRI